MKEKMAGNIGIILIFNIALFCYIPLCNADLQTPKNKLTQIIHNIVSLKKNINLTHKKRITVQQQLKHVETLAGNLAIEINKTKQKIHITQNTVTKLLRQREDLNHQLQTQQDELAKQMRAIYVLGKNRYLKLLLNNEDINKLGRLTIYYNYLQQYRIKVITNLNNTLQILHQNKRAVKQQADKLNALKATQQTTYQKLIQSKQDRAKLLITINNQINTQQQKMQELIADKKSLEELIARLKAQTISTAFATPLNELKNKLPWPVQGKINYLFGTKIENSELTWAADIITAAKDQKVYAISNGKVVYAGWLAGYGLLIIINHGHGFMSLYGRNNSLYKKVGDIVSPREVIATVGDSGGYANPGLYFAIRHNGEPVDPKLWCKL